jgi:hypothetical protein
LGSIAATVHLPNEIEHTGSRASETCRLPLLSFAEDRDHFGEDGRFNLLALRNLREYLEYRQA